MKLRVNLGDVITLRLNENPTTGYRWFQETSSGLEIVDDNNEPGGAVGAGGVRVLRFRVKRGGSHELRMKNWREWEGEDSVIGRFTVKIRVNNP